MLYLQLLVELSSDLLRYDCDALHLLIIIVRHVLVLSV
jgi:hypothetical protein